MYRIGSGLSLLRKPNHYTQFILILNNHGDCKNYYYFGGKNIIKLYDTAYVYAIEYRGVILYQKNSVCQLSAIFFFQAELQVEF